MKLFCLLTGHEWINTVSIEKQCSEKKGIFDFDIKRKRVCKKCGYKQFLEGVDWKKEPPTKKELRYEKIKKLLK